MEVEVSECCLMVEVVIVYDYEKKVVENAEQLQEVREEVMLILVVTKVMVKLKVQSRLMMMHNWLGMIVMGQR